MQQRLELVEKRTERLEARSKMNSQNSSKPPSSDGPFNKQPKKAKKSKRNRGAQKGHKGHHQQMLNPSKIENILPKSCDCGRLIMDPDSIKPFYTHQHIELQTIELDVMHLVLNQGKCQCGKIVKAVMPAQYTSGYGPKL